LQDPPVLESAGYKVIIPAWWTPKGHQRARCVSGPKGALSAREDKAKSYFGYDTLVQYQTYRLAVNRLQNQNGWNWSTQTPWFSSGTVDAPEPGQNAANAGVLEKQQKENPELTLLDFMRLTAEGNEELEVEFDRDQTWQRCP